MKILIADDHAMMRSGLKLLLGEAFKDAEFGEASTSQQTLEAALSQSWDLILLDISMPGRGGLDVLKEYRVQHPKTPVLILSMYAEPQFAERAFRAGATGYITKASAGNELLLAVERVLTGRRYVSSALAEYLVSVLGSNTAGPLHGRLSSREFEILRFIASGKAVKEMASELSLSGSTISTYRTRILEKMQMRNNAELTHYALSHHLVE
jgi:DNA-binding NarL/FixJ family response regulator